MDNFFEEINRWNKSGGFDKVSKEQVDYVCEKISEILHISTAEAMDVLLFIDNILYQILDECAFSYSTYANKMRINNNTISFDYEEHCLEEDIEEYKIYDGNDISIDYGKLMEDFVKKFDSETALEWVNPDLKPYGVYVKDVELYENDVSDFRQSVKYYPGDYYNPSSEEIIGDEEITIYPTVRVTIDKIKR